MAAAAAAKSLQSCSTLCDPIDSSLPGSPVPGILQARTLEWLPFPSPVHESEKWKWSLSVVSDSSETPWTAAHQAPPSMGFSRQEYWSRVPSPSLRNMARHSKYLLNDWTNTIPKQTYYLSVIMKNTVNSKVIPQSYKGFYCLGSLLKAWHCTVVIMEISSLCILLN